MTISKNISASNIFYLPGKKNEPGAVYVWFKRRLYRHDCGGYFRTHKKAKEKMLKFLLDEYKRREDLTKKKTRGKIQ